MFRILIIVFCVLSFIVIAEEVDSCSTPSECVSVIAVKVGNNTTYSEEFIDHFYVTRALISLNDEFQITSFKIQESSGNRLFDNAIERAIERTKSLPELKGLPENQQIFFKDFSMKFRSVEKLKK